MKTLALFILALAMAARAATFTIGWNDTLNNTNPTNQVGGYWIWLGSSNAGVRLGSVGRTNRAILTLPDGAYRLSVSATNVFDDAESLLFGESPKSLPLYVVVTGSNVLAVTGGGPLNAPTSVQLR